VNCLHCREPIDREYRWSSYVHGSSKEIECEGGVAEPDVEELVTGAARRLAEFAKGGVGREDEK
jgi:hypothetical protein